METPCEKAQSVWNSVVRPTGSKAKVIVEHGEKIWYKEWPCHSFLGYVPDKPNITGFSSGLATTDTTLSKAFHDWIFNPALSPWKDALKNGVSYVYKPGDDYPIAFHLHSLDGVPAQALAALCMASRMAGEFPPTMRLFNTLLQSGFTHDVAMYACHFYGQDQDGWVRRPKGYNYNHWPFLSGCALDWVRFLERTPKYTTGLFMEGSSYAGASALYSTLNNAMHISAASTPRWVVNKTFTEKDFINYIREVQTTWENQLIKNLPMALPSSW